MAKEIAAGTGRRKTAVARVRLVPGEGKWFVNDKAIEQYIHSEAMRQYLAQPLALTGLEAVWVAFRRKHEPVTENEVRIVAASAPAAVTTERAVTRRATRAPAPGAATGQAARPRIAPEPVACPTVRVSKRRPMPARVNGTDPARPAQR